jgi:hypothetical protein
VYRWPYVLVEIPEQDMGARPESVTLPDPREEPTISVPRAGAILGLSRPSSYDAAKRGDIPTLRIGRRLVVPTARLLDEVDVLAEAVRHLRAGP